MPLSPVRKRKSLLGNHALIEGLKSQADPLTLWLAVQKQAAHFMERSKPYLLY